MAFESGIVPEDWRSSMIFPLYKGKGERTECSNYRGVNLLNMVGKIYSLLWESKYFVGYHFSHCSNDKVELYSSRMLFLL